MRSTLSLALAALLLTVSGGAMAQTEANTGYTPTYKPTGSSVYNSAQVAGRNAPSYSFNNGQASSQPYSFNGSPNSDYSQGSPGIMTPEQATAARALRDQQAAQAQAQYMAEMQRNGGMPADAAALYKSGHDGVDHMLAPEEQKPKKRRVVYNKKNNDSAMTEPPRLFDPDQR